MCGSPITFVNRVCVCVCVGVRLHACECVFVKVLRREKQQREFNGGFAEADGPGFRIGM